MQIEAKNISFRYNDKSPWVLENVSLSVEEGERVGLLGPSGRGKSTLIKLMAGYLKPEKGEILLDGKPLPLKGVSPVQLIYQHPEKAINPRWKMKKVLQESGMYNEEIMKRLGIEKDWLERYPRELSGGELQRFCVARSLFAGTRFLFADEISTMLDVITQAQIWNFLIEETEKRNIGMIVVSHNQELLKKVCTRVVELKN
nr:ATP-binding cassette domain-containing protein [uncultured Blautia sp.]